MLIPGVTKRYGTNFRTRSSDLEDEIMLYEHGPGNAFLIDKDHCDCQVLISDGGLMHVSMLMVGILNISCEKVLCGMLVRTSFSVFPIY